MKKLCMIYGNCQHTHLQNFLEQTDFINYFNLVKVKDVYLKDKSYLDDDTLSKIDLFIYQHVSSAFDPFLAQIIFVVNYVRIAFEYLFLIFGFLLISRSTHKIL
ncbi:putative capsule O-acetyl transferase [Escherichia coli]|uniref:Putative capsule O-acetyl transferase n=1 Tax=Escherichia coli TaxID=562 RepID=A0A377K080_ECOLX|nr:putative capsule O-acetyl transferase [Escherichia coli]